jgi:4-amino-4-deoxy-L-arabinose transferase-like glycosyltransferase
MLLGGVAVGALLFRAMLALAIAPFQAPDEAAHLRYVEHVGRTARLPVQPREATSDHWEQSYQPPLAYIVFALVDRGLEPLGLSHDDRLRALRLVNAVAGTALVVVAYGIAARVMAPGTALLVAVIVAFLPGIAASASALNNDTLANLLAAILWLPLLRENTPRTAWVTGIVLGVACLTKLSVLALGPLLFLVPLCRDPRDLPGALRHALRAGSAALLVLSPWMLRNYLVYGDPLAIGVGSISFASITELPAEAVAALARPRPDRAFAQFWGHFGIYNNIHWNVIQLILPTVSAIALLAWLLPRGEEVRFTRGAATAFCIAVVLAIVGLSTFSLRYHAAWQGRYLYTAIVPIAALLAGGWHRVLPVRARAGFGIGLTCGLAVLDALLVVRLHEFFSSVSPGRWPFPASL